MYSTEKMTSVAEEFDAKTSVIASPAVTTDAPGCKPVWAPVLVLAVTVFTVEPSTLSVARTLPDPLFTLM